MSCNNIIPVLPGSRFSARDKLGRVSYFEFVGLHEPDACGNTVRLHAIGETLKEYESSLMSFKENNASCESVQRITFEDFCLVEVEPAWFGERKITILEVQ